MWTDRNNLIGNQNTPNEKLTKIIETCEKEYDARIVSHIIISMLAHSGLHIQ